MSIDENNAYRITERLAFPRLTGSEGEPKAIEVVIDEFKNAGYDKIHEEKFMTSFSNWITARYIFFPLAIAIILIAISIFINAWITLILIGLLLGAAAIIGGKLLNNTEIGLMKDPEKNYETENIYTELKSKNSKATILFMGHWDSKSQNFPTIVRILVMALPILGVLLLLLIYLILSLLKIIALIDLPPFNTFLLYVSIITGSIGALNYFNKTGNKSPGAIDNATAVGTVIELARYFKQNPQDNIDFYFIIPGSEELNLGGAKTFMKNHHKELDPKSTYCINYDGIGGTGFIRLITSYGIPRKVASKKLNDLFMESSEKLNITTKSIYLPIGAWSDFMPVIQYGFEACWLASKGGEQHVHTKRDNMSIISKEGLKNGLDLTLDVIKKLNNELK